MILEELIAKLGFRISGTNEAKKFIRQIEDARKALKGLDKGFKVNFTGGASGLGRTIRDFERAAAAARRFRQEAERASRVRQPSGRGGGRYGPGAGIGPTDGSGGGGGGGSGAVAAGALAASRFSKAQMAAGAVATAAGSVLAVKRFANLESAARELGLTAEQSRERVSSDIERFRSQAPALGATTQEQVGVAKQFAAAGMDYDTAIGSVVPVVRTAKASFGELGDVAEAGIASVNNLKISVTDLGQAFDIIAKAGKLGQVEVKDLAKALPTVASSGAKLGLTGTSGLADIAAAIEIARKTAPTGDIAANNVYNLFEKVLSDEVGKAFKKKDIDLEGEIKKGQKDGVSVLDTVMRLVKDYTKGDGFRMNELFGDMQARNAMTALLQNEGEFQQMRKRIKEESGGTIDKDFKEAMDRTAGSFDQFSAAIDRAIGRVGEFLAPAARAAMDTVTGALEGSEGKKQTDAERDATVGKLNKLLGEPPTYHGVFGEYGKKAAAPFDQGRFGAGMGPARKPTFMQPQQTGTTAPTFGSTGDRMDWMRQGTQATTTNNVTNNTNTGNDQRTQTASVTVNATGLAEVAALVKSNVQSGLSSMGASIVKGNSASTGASAAP